MSNIKLSTTHWDCECDGTKEEPFRYIHINELDSCPVCGSEREDSPDSRIEEVNFMIAHNKGETE